MITSACSAIGNLHVFQVQHEDVFYTWQKAGETAWNGGKKGKSPADFSFFASAPTAITGITASLSSDGNLHLFVDCADGHTYYTWQKKGESAWHGGEPGKAVAGLTLFA